MNPSNGKKAKKVYVTPELTSFGSIEELTQCKKFGRDDCWGSYSCDGGDNTSG